MKPDCIKHTVYCLLVLCCMVSQAVRANGISIDWLNNEKIDNDYVLNARISYTFSNEILDALEHGVPLYFNVEIKTLMKRSLLWDKTISTETLNYRLEFHPLSERYLLTEYNRFKRHDYRSLDAALNSMGRINEYPFADARSISPQYEYIASIRVMLDNKSLPAPLRPLSYISSDWQLSSSWNSMELVQ